MYRSKYVLYKKLKLALFFFANNVLFLLIIILLIDVLRNYRTINDVLAAKPPLKRRF
jgi:hypothetical protein